MSGGSHGGRIFRSSDFAKNFVQTELPFHPLVQIAYHPQNSDCLLALSTDVRTGARAGLVPGAGAGGELRASLAERPMGLQGLRGEVGADPQSRLPGQVVSGHSAPPSAGKRSGTAVCCGIPVRCVPPVLSSPSLPRGANNTIFFTTYLNNSCSEYCSLPAGALRGHGGSCRDG